MRLGFMGSPDFVLDTFKILLNSSHDVVCVYTKPPKPSGRGKHLMKTAVHEFAESKEIEVRAVKTLRDEAEQKYLRDLNLDLLIVAAYGVIIPQEVLDIPRLGCINIHPSILPRWRGAAPIHWTILAGDKKAGVCIMKLVQALDAGDVYKCVEIDIEDEETESLTHKLFELGSESLIQVIDDLEKGIDIATPQSIDGLTYASKLDKQVIDWSDDVVTIERKIRALSAQPGIFFYLNGERIRIYRANYVECMHEYEMGEVINNEFHVSCAGGIIKPLLLQRPGKKPIDIESFLRGLRVQITGLKLT